MGRDTFALVAAIDWTPVIVALITLAGVGFNGWIALKLNAKLRTPSKTTVGSQVEQANLTAIGNNYMLQRLSRELGIGPEPVGNHPERSVESDAG